MEKNAYSLHLYDVKFVDIQSKIPKLQPLRANTQPISANSGAARAIQPPAGIVAGSVPFRREIMLPRLIPIGPAEIADGSAAARWLVVKRLAKALRGERSRGRAGHWTYSLNRHIGLLQAFEAERSALRRLFPKSLRERQPS